MDALAAAQPPPAGGEFTERFKFTGQAGEYFRIWIVNLLLTIVTLGVYSAWAKVRRLRYFAGHSWLAGSAFEYHGQPRQILKGRMIAAAFIIPYLLVAYLFPPWDALFIVLLAAAMPFLVVKSRLFTARMTSWRNIRFDFVGTYRRAAVVYIGFMLLTVLTLGLLFPYWTYARQRFLIENSKFGATPFDFRARVVDYYLATLFAGLIVVTGVFVGALFMGGAAVAVGDANAASMGPMMVLGVVLMGLSYLLAYAFLQARIANVAYSNTHLAQHRINSELEMWPLFGLYVTNALGVALSLGLLIPWAQIRLHRYQLERLSLQVNGSLDQFAGEQQQQVAATGEEIGDLLDVDFGL